MSWRNVIIAKRSKLDLRLNNLIIRRVDNTQKINLDEIATVIVESTEVSITTALIAEMAKKKIKLIFCDEKHNPVCECANYYGTYNSSGNLYKQIHWSKNFKKIVWQKILDQKIKNQIKILEKSDKSKSKIREIINLADMHEGNLSSVEGVISKQYFYELFGSHFSRSMNTVENAALNYGYQIILASFNRAITLFGYSTQIGIYHSNKENHFNLGSDFMEPLRPMVDLAVYRGNFENFGIEEKRYMQTILKEKLFVKDKQFYLQDAIERYTRSVLNALDNDDISLLNFCVISNEL